MLHEIARIGLRSINKWIDITPRGPFKLRPVGPDLGRIQGSVRTVSGRIELVG